MDALRDASSRTFTADGRRFQRLSERHGMGLFAPRGVADRAGGRTRRDTAIRAGGNSVRGWELDPGADETRPSAMVEHLRRDAVRSRSPV